MASVVKVKERVSLEKGAGVARHLVELLGPACERIEVVGSVRRGSPTVGDVEVLCVPRTEIWEQDSFLGEGRANVLVNALDEVLEDLKGSGVMADRLGRDGKRAWGSRDHRALFRGFPVDIYAVLPPAWWGVLQVIRTGPEGFGHHLMTSVQYGGWMPQGMRVEDGALRDRRSGVELTVPCPDERAFFAAIGRPYLEPASRRWPL